MEQPPFQRAETLPHPSRPSPWWARAAVGLFVGVLGGVVLSAIIAAVALGLTLLAPGLGAANIWKAAAVVAGLSFVVGVVRCVWRSVRDAPDARAGAEGQELR